MAKTSKFKSDLSEALHSSATMLHTLGALDKATMRDFDARHLAVADEMKSAQIKRLREANNVSQPVFAAISTRVRAPSRSGKRAPSGPVVWRSSC